MESITGQLLEPNKFVATLQVKKNWLKNVQNDQEYRNYLHLAFEKAQLKYHLRQPQITEEKKSMIFRRIDGIERIKITEVIKEQQAGDSYLTQDPQFPDLGNEKLKLLKISRNCRKKVIQRFFQLDNLTESLVYFKKETDAKPKKAVSLDECRVRVQKLKVFEKQSLEEQQNKINKWTEQDKGYRLQINLKSRKFQPIYYYTESQHKAYQIQILIERLLNSGSNQDLLKSLIGQVCIIHKLMEFRHVANIISILKANRGQTLRMLRVFKTLAYNFYVEKREMLDLLMLKDEPVQQQEAPAPIPQIRSTFKFGQVVPIDYFHLRNYSKVHRMMISVAKLIKEGKKRRHPVIQDLIQSKLSIKNFPLTNGMYRVHDQIVDNLHKLGDIPYLVSEVNDIVNLRIENDNLIIQDRKKHEYHILISEICYMCTDIGYSPAPQQGQWRLQLRGRKINQNVEMMGENILSQQIGYEKQKYSRMTNKLIVRFSLKSITIPMSIQEQLNNFVINQQDKVMFRLKFEVGEFHCYTPLFWTKKQSTLELKEDLNIELHDAKYFKITLVAVKGRQTPYNQAVNEFLNEQIVSFVSLRLKDYEDNEHGELLHKIPFNKLFYNPNETQTQRNANNIVLTTAFMLMNVHGAQQTIEMEGNHALVGRYAVYKKQVKCKILKLNKNHSCQVQILENQPLASKFGKNLLLDNVSIKQDLSLIERYGISILNIDHLPQNYSHGQFEWSLDVLVSQQEQMLLSKIFDAISHHQIKSIYQQRLQGAQKKGRSQAFVCGRLFLSVMNAQNLQNSDKNSPCDTFVQISIQDSKNQSNSKFIDIANEASFIQCKKNSDQVQDKVFRTSVIPQSNNPSWVSKQNPHGEVFDLGMFMKKYPHFIIIEIYHQKKKSRFSSEAVPEMIGFAELNSEDLISIDYFGQEFYMFLEDSMNRNSLIKIRSLFVPSIGTIDRLNLEPSRSIFKNAQQFLFYNVLHMTNYYDEFGYKVPLGKYLIDFHLKDENFFIAQNKDPNSSLVLESSYFQHRYEKFSPEHKKHMQLQDQNPLRPKVEENVYLFKLLWLYIQFFNRNKALINRQRIFWEEFMNDLMTSTADVGLIEDELKSILSKLTNTTKMISSTYKKRSKVFTNNKDQGGQRVENETKGSKFSVLFVGQWEKMNSWKYVDIWFLVKYGIPQDLRVSLWKDLLRRQINEQQAYVYFKKSNDYKDYYNENISTYENLKVLANLRDSIYYQQVENDILEFNFPEGYLKNQPTIRDDRMEEERSSLYQIFKVYGLWAHELSKRRLKAMVYNNGMLAIVQRFLSFMTEEDAFWNLVGIVKAFNNVFTYDFKQQPNTTIDQYVHFNPFINRRASFKNEMNIIICCIRIHFPQVFEHLKSLSVPLQWYFYESFASFFTNVFSTDIVFRLWDIMILNLSINQMEQRKRALWYLLATPLYMIQVNLSLILKTQNPIRIKEILLKNTPALNYNPNIFIEELLNIIKQVFVRKENMLNKLLKNDKPHQLDYMRNEVEQEFLKKYKESQDKSVEIAKFMIERGINLQVNLRKNLVQYINEKVQLSIKVLGFRNILVPQLDEEHVTLQLSIEGEEQVKPQQFEFPMPQDNEAAQFQPVTKKLEFITNLSGDVLNKKITVRLDLIENGIHQHFVGKGIINIASIVSSAIESYVTLKLAGSTDHQNSYVDLRIQVQSKQRSEKNQIQGIYDQHDLDIHQKTKDEETKRLFKSGLDFNSYKSSKDYLLQALQSDQMVLQTKSLLTSMSGIAKQELDLAVSHLNYNQNLAQASVLQESKQILNGLQYLSSHISASQYIVETLELQQDAQNEYSELLLKILAHGQNVTNDQLFEQLYLMFERTNKIDMAKLIYHMYQVSHYPMPMNEIIQLLNIELSNNYSYVVKVVQQQSVDAVNENFFGKVFSGNQQFQIYDVTDAFRLTLNQVQRLTGLWQYVDLSQEPFNNINFWLRGTNNNLRKVGQMLSVSIADSNGDQQLFRFKFNSQGLLTSISPEHRSILPLQLNGQPILTIFQFKRLLTSTFPLLSNFIRQDLFLKEQLYGSQEVYVDSSEVYRVTFNSLKHKFIFKFSSDTDKQEDFTVDPSQLMRIAKGDINQIYRKVIIGEQQIIEVSLSALSKQDTFLRIKQRMRMALDFVVQNENLRDVPNIMSEKFQFKMSGQDTNELFNSMNRLINVTGPKDTQFELVRVPPTHENEPYSSYALYTHPNGFKEWRPCKILLKLPGLRHDPFKIEFEHEPNTIYMCPREDILLSFDYKRSMENYYKDEIQEFLDKLDKEESQIAQIFNEQEKNQQQLDDVKRQLQFDRDEMGGQLRINLQQLDEEKDEEVVQMRKIINEEIEVDSYYASGVSK